MNAVTCQVGRDLGRLLGVTGERSKSEIVVFGIVKHSVGYWMYLVRMHHCFTIYLLLPLICVSANASLLKVYEKELKVTSLYARRC